MAHLHLRILFCYLFICLLALSAQGAPLNDIGNDRERQAYYNLENQVALSGYDPVSYRSGNEPEKGHSEYQVTQAGVTYYFISDANREAFRRAPSRYEPAYGGWCAWSMSQGETKPVNPDSFLIVRDRLLLFSDNLTSNARKNWLKAAEAQSEAQLIQAANTHWRELLGKR